MSILGYSASYFLPEYWSNTPLYGEKIIPLLDYVLSTDYTHADKLANAFYTLENKYKNTADLPIGAIEALIEESGYSYVKDLLGNDEESIRLLTYLLVLIHQLKGTKLGIEVVLGLLKKTTNPLVMGVIGSPTIDAAKNVGDFTVNDYIRYAGFTTDDDSFDINLQIKTGALSGDQCIASSANYGIYLGLNSNGNLVLSLSSDRASWNILQNKQSNATLQPNTWYYIKLSFDGYEYTVGVSTDNKKFTNYISFTSSETTNIHKGTLYIGVDDSTGTTANPFKGLINLTPFSMDVQSVTITQWFENFPVGDENTFIVKADLDVNLVSSDFFSNFAKFVKKYVYPTLEAFEAKLEFQNNLTFIPYVRQRVTYIASGDVNSRSTFTTSNNEDFLVKSALTGDYESFDVIDVNPFITSDDKELLVKNSRTGEYDSFNLRDY